MIKKIFKALFCKNNFSTEWRKRNSHNFTIPATNFKMDAVQVGKGTYGNFFFLLRDSPFNSILLILLTKRSMLASAIVAGFPR